MVLLALLLGMMGFVIWYVIDRRAKRQDVPAAPEPVTAQSPAVPPAGTEPTVAPVVVLPPTAADPVIVLPPAPVVPVTAPTPAAAPVDLTQHDSQTIDFSSGSPAVKDTAEDRAAIEQAKKDMAEAVKGISFGPPAKKAAPLPAPSAEPPKP